MTDRNRIIIAGDAAGAVIALDEPLSFWGGFDPATGQIIDQHHPQVGVELTGAIVAMATGRGSSSASTVLAEAIRGGTAPAALVMREVDGIIALGALVAEELYRVTMPIVLVDERTFARIAAADTASISRDGTILTTP